ncbi:hypothetical protein [Aeromonas sp. 61P]|uniref:hypothetical protein n=1 Tax=Aeromonas sp. 61P TaxID=3452721 RepID=UPI003F79344E
MSKFDSKKIISFLSNKWKGRGCPMCNSGPWNVPDNTFQLMEFHGGNLVMGGPLIPVIPVSCENCGHTILVNAIIAGVVEPESPSPTREKA